MRAINAAKKYKYELLLTCLAAVVLFTELAGGSSLIWLLREYYLVDYSVGFFSRLFVGSVVTQITDDFSDEWLTGFVFSACILAAFLAARVFGKAIRSLEGDAKLFMQAAAILFFILPFAFRCFAAMFGYLDVFIFLCAAAIVFCLMREKTVWFAPPLVFLGVCIHTGFLLQYFPVIAVMLLYLAAKNKSKKYVSLFCVCVAVCLLAELYFAVFAKYTVQVDLEGLHAHIRSKIGSGAELKNFYDFYILGIYDETLMGMPEGSVTEYERSFIEILKGYFIIGKRFFDSKSFYRILLGFAGVCAAFDVLFATLMRRARGFWNKSVFFCAVMIPLTGIAGAFMSTDTERWLTAACISQFMFAAFLVCDKNSDAQELFERAGRFMRKHPAVLFAAFIGVSSLLTIK